MSRYKASFPIPDGEVDNIKNKMLNWSNQFSILILLDSNHYSNRYSCYECLLAVNPVGEIFSTLDDAGVWHKANKDWLLGHINYDYKNQLEPRLKTNNPAHVGFPAFSFFCPETVCYISTDKTQLVVETLLPNPVGVYEEIIATPLYTQRRLPRVSFIQRTSKEKYLSVIHQLKEHIRNGDCYEINYCNENYAEGIILQPMDAFVALDTLSNAPFAAYYRNEDKYLICASPERYIQNQGGAVISQPIKGTARRSADAQQDEQIKKELAGSIKDRAENVMITDLVRNDIARSCDTGTVQVKELFGIYTFPQVHQMISTVSGQLSTGTTFLDVLKYSFPMGSMTGAPKIKVMELVDNYEDVARELFAGTVGYVTPEGDFDFNVVIRSLYYNSSTQYLSYQAGGAITYDSDPESEWEEMQLKSWAMQRIFNQEG